MFTIPPDLVPALETEFRRGWQMKRVGAEIEAKTVAANSNHQAHRSIDGIGSLRMRVPGDAYHFWGQKLGYACWNDKQFLAEFERDNEACKVNSVGTKIQVGHGTGMQRRSSTAGKIIIPGK
jgi:hypothetical protein